MRTEINESKKYLKAVEHVEELKGFYASLFAYCIVIPFLIYLNLKYSPEYQWFWFPLAGWGVGLLFQGIRVFVFDPFFVNEWENRKIKEFMSNDEKEFWE